MAFGDTINTYKATGLGAAEASVTITNTPVSGNLLVFGVGRAITHTAGGDWGTPSGWTRIHDSGINTGNLGGCWFFKISDGTETSVATAGSGFQGTWQAFVAELEGSFAASPLDVAAEDAANIATVVTSQTSGTTGTTAQNDELALAFFASDRMDTVDTSRVYSNSFTEVVFTDQQTTRAASMLAKKVLSATGTVECTFSVTDTGDEMYGSVATFKKLVSGGTAIVPIVDRQYRSRRS
jgi:hypothetical protein